MTIAFILLLLLFCVYAFFQNLQKTAMALWIAENAKEPLRDEEIKRLTMRVLKHWFHADGG